MKKTLPDTKMIGEGCDLLPALKCGVLNPVQFSIILIVSGIVTVTGNVNLGTVLAGIGLLVEAIKMMVQQGF